MEHQQLLENVAILEPPAPDDGNDDDNNNNDNNNNNDPFVVELNYLGGKIRSDGRYTEEIRELVRSGEPFRLRIDQSVTVIDNNACVECAGFIEVLFHNNVTRIEQAAFYSCVNFHRMELPHHGLVYLGANAFFRCSSLEGEILIPASVQHIDFGAFRYCNSLQRVVFDSTSNIQFGPCIFSMGRYQSSQLRSVVLPQNMQLIPTDMFLHCISLTDIKIPSSVKVIERYAFGYCTNLKMIVNSKNVTSIGDHAWRGCTSLEKVSIFSSSNSNMGDVIFQECPSLNTIKIYPWLWPKLFVKHDTDFMFKFFKHYHDQIFNFGTLIHDRRRHNNNSKKKRSSEDTES